MIKEEIMDIDEEDNQNSESVVKKEPALRPKSNDFKYKLLERLENSDTSLTQNLTLAITIQTMFNKDPEVLERLFRFFIDQKQMEMALDLWENDIIKRFNLSAVAEFDVHLKRIVTQIIFHLSVKALSEREKKQLTKLEIDPIDEFYLELFLKLSQPSQEKLVTQLLDKYRNGFSFLKISSTEAVNVKKEQPTLQQSIDIREFYSKLIEVKDTIFTTRSLLTIYKKFIPDYGLFLIDGFLNIEKQLFANLIQNSSQTEQILSNIEKRSLKAQRHRDHSVHDATRRAASGASAAPLASKSPRLSPQCERKIARSRGPTRPSPSRSHCTRSNALRSSCVNCMSPSKSSRANAGVTEEPMCRASTARSISDRTPLPSASPNASGGQSGHSRFVGTLRKIRVAACSSPALGKVTSTESMSCTLPSPTRWRYVL